MDLDLKKQVIQRLNEIRDCITQNYCAEFDLPQNIQIEIADLPQDICGRVLETTSDKPIIKIATKLFIDIKNCHESQEEQNKLIAILNHTIHHELCHIDIDRRNPIIKNTSDIDTLHSNPDLYLFAISICISEYLACALSYQTCSMERIECNCNIDEFRKNKDFTYFIEYILKPVVYFLGETNKQELMHRIRAYKALANDGLVEHIQNIDLAMERLLNKYPNITINDLKSESKGISDTYDYLCEQL